MRGHLNGNGIIELSTGTWWRGLSAGLKYILNIQYFRLFVASDRQTMNNVLPQQQESNAFWDSADNVLNTIFS